MPPVHRFKLELAGQTVYGLAFATEAELDRFCADRGLDLARPVPVEDARPRGRPSFHAAISAAVAALHVELAGCDNAAARARLVQRHIARTAPDAASVPSTHTIAIYLGKPVGKSFGKSLGKSRRRKIAAGG